MKRSIYSEYRIGDLVARYVLEAECGRIGLELIPASMTSHIAVRRESIGDEPFIASIPGGGQPPSMRVAPLVQVHVTGDWFSGAFAQGRTMLFSGSIDRFRFDRQLEDHRNGRHQVITQLRADDGCEIAHTLAWTDGDAAGEVSACFTNRSARAVGLELLSSFCLGGITPFDAADASGQLVAHRFRSAWSAEGRLDTQTIEQLHLERSWSGSGLMSERFGQVGSMPVRGWFPFVAIEDLPRGVVWAAQVAWAGSWQMEIARLHDELLLAGGLADREFGHWKKTLAPGESIVTPTAAVTCVRGDLDDACDRLTALQQKAADAQPEVDQSLPIVFNEWCTTWGDPTEQKVTAIADRLAGTPTKYLVIDAGWYKPDNGSWDNGHGDWIPNVRLFPNGLKAAADAIRARGFIPGIWFEMETVGSTSAAFNRTDLLLQRDGHPVTVRNRRFWDLNNAAAVDYLTERVIDLIASCRFGYLKVDYNETIGLGSSGESLGEGLREHILGVYRFFDRIRSRLPDLVIENCSSGGHRLEPSMLGRTAMSSFSDAHELPEIPIIAANLHRLMLPRQSQIWAVLHGSDSDQRLIYSLAATFLGRMCLSGGITDLSDLQWRLVTDAQALYTLAAPIIKHGVSRRFGKVGPSWRHPKGYQIVRRLSADGRHALVVAHQFAEPGNSIGVGLPEGTWRIAGTLAVDSGKIELREGGVHLRSPAAFEGVVVLLERA